MKAVNAIIRPFKLDDVRAAMEQLGLGECIVVEAKAYPGSSMQTYRGAKYLADFLPRLLVTIVVADERVDETIAAICSKVRHGATGDGTITITHVERVIEITPAKQLAATG